MNTIYRLISTIIDLTSLDRYGKQSSSTYGKIDDLTCSYDGNHLTAISDNAPTPTISGSFDFKDSTGVSTEYLYDANGNMTKDANKGITQILYNHLNRPSRIAMVKGSSTSTIDYVYSASGAKLRVIHRPNVMSPLSTTTDYINGYIFTNNLSIALTDNGYYTLSRTGDPTYYFYLKDHQGNNRVVVSQSGSVEQTNHYYPYGALFEWHYLHVRHHFGRKLGSFRISFYLFTCYRLLWLYALLVSVLRTLLCDSRFPILLNIGFDRISLCIFRCLAFLNAIGSSNKLKRIMQTLRTRKRRIRSNT